MNLVGVFKQLLDRTVLFLALHCLETFSGFNIAENLAVTAEFTFIKSDLQSLGKMGSFLLVLYGNICNYELPCVLF